ncbi:NifU family protein [bacterium SCSIO 12741]|nr:NifU family protein [bacterium SCSIO 12741]
MEEVKKRKPVSIYAESTPNPGAMKFVSTRTFLHDGVSVEYNSPEEAGDSPLAQRLFTFPFVTGVFITANFITVIKNDLVEWQEVFGEVREYIQNYLATDHPVFSKTPVEAEAQPEANAKEEEQKVDKNAPVIPQNEMEEKIMEILEDYVRPAVASDGGAIEFNSYSEGKLTLTLKGACSGCPSSTVTLKNGIQNLFNQMLPEVKDVVALED